MTDQAVSPDPSFPRDLPPKQVDVWCARLDVPSEVAGELYCLLSLDEKARADRFCFARHRSRFIVSRGALRELLGGYLRVAPESISLAYNEKRKPCLRADANLPSQERVQFNASHSESLAVLAFSRESDLGVDIEYMQRDLDYQAIFERYFTEPEKAHLRSLPPASRRLAFFRLWTRKEACLKATGDGLRVALDSLMVPLEIDLGESVQLTLNGLPEVTMYPLEPATGYVGTLVAAGSRHDLRMLVWQPGLSKVRF